MELLLRPGLFRKQDDITNQIKQSNTQFLVLFERFQAVEVVFHLSLCCELRLELISAHGERVEEAFLDILAHVRTKPLEQDRVRDEGFDVAVRLEADASPHKFTDVHWDCRHEVTHNSLHRVNRDAPNAEKTQDVVNTKCIEIVPHLSEALLP